MVDPTLVSAGAGFIGAIIGAGAALWSQYITQRAITERERLERVRKEQQLRLLFGTRLEAAQTVVRYAVSGMIWGSQVTDAYAPLAAMVSSPVR